MPTPLRSLAPSVLALLAGAAVLLGHPAARYSLWYDEAWTLQTISSHNAAAIVETLRHDFTPPLYYLALSAWSSATGISEPALRYLSTLCAMVAAAITLRLAADLYRSRAAGWMAAVILVSMPFHIRFALEVRMYAMLATFTAASMLLFWRRLARPRPVLAPVYVLVTAAAIYVHYLALFASALQLAYGVVGISLQRRRERKGITGESFTVASSRLRDALLPLASLALFAPWLPVFFAQLNSPDYLPSHSHALPTTWPTIRDTLIRYFFAGQPIVYAALIVLACAKLEPGLRRRLSFDEPRPLGFLAVWGLGWLILMWGTNAAVPHFQPRNALPALSVLAVLAGRALSKPPRVVGILALAVLAVVNLGAYDKTQSHDPHYRDAVVALAVNYRPGDLIFLQTNSFLHDIPLQHYLDTLLPPHPAPVWLNGLAGGPGADGFPQAFAEQAGGNARFWFLQTLPVDNSWVSQAVPHAEATAVEVDAFRITLYVAP